MIKPIRHIPKGAVKVAAKNSDAIAYLYEDSRGRPCARVFYGAQSKPVAAFYYRSVARREEAVTQLFASRAQALAAKLAAAEARKPAGFWDAVEAELARLNAEPAPEFWTFNSTGEAYNYCQCDARIKSGAMLVIESERVVGMAWAWPIAITAQAGKLHEAESPAIVTNADDMGASPEQLAAAKAECVKRGWPLHAVFA